jgi:hypothetical protein
MSNIAANMVMRAGVKKSINKNFDIPEKDHWGVSVGVSAVTGSVGGMILGALWPSTISGKTNCRKCGTEYWSDMLCPNHCIKP